MSDFFSSPNGLELQLRPVTTSAFPFVWGPPCGGLASLREVRPAEVVAVGDSDEVNVSAGDVVVLAKYSGTEVKIDGEEHLIVDADDILGMMES
jgi:hypothetical protein